MLRFYCSDAIRIWECRWCISPNNFQRDRLAEGVHGSQERDAKTGFCVGIVCRKAAFRHFVSSFLVGQCTFGGSLHANWLLQHMQLMPLAEILCGSRHEVSHQRVHVRENQKAHASVNLIEHIRPHRLAAFRQGEEQRCRDVTDSA